MLNGNEFDKNENGGLSEEGTNNESAFENSAADKGNITEESPAIRETQTPGRTGEDQSGDVKEEVLSETPCANENCQNSANDIPNTAPATEPSRQTGAGIRYNVDKNAGDGNYTWNYCEPKEPKKKSNKGFVAFLAVALTFIVVGTAAFCAVITSTYVNTGSFLPETDIEDELDKPVIGQDNADVESDKKDNKPGTSDESLPHLETVINTGDALSKQEIAVKCKPSSVGIQVTSKVYSVYGYSYPTSGVGSGFILTSDGYIATNHHVIEEASEIIVQLDDGTKHEAVLVGSDSITDLAVIKIDAEDLVPMEIGDSDKMVVGDSVIAIGTPAGIEFAGTVTDGIISAINRNIEITNERGAVVKTMTLMQTNAAINPGNSGGPLINDKGQVIGINTLKLTSSYEGIGFSIPINSAVKIFNQLIADGKVSEYDDGFVTGNGAIGITQYAEVSREEAKYYGIPEGIIVIQIKNTSAAVSAGLRRGDMIIGFCGTQVKTVDELNKLKSKYKAGDEVTLRIYRDGEGEKDITFKLDLMES